MVARMFDILPESLQYWYQNILSDYLPDLESKKWHPAKIETVDKSTGEIREKPVYILNHLKSATKKIFFKNDFNVVKK